MDFLQYSLDFRFHTIQKYYSLRVFWCFSSYEQQYVTNTLIMHSCVCCKVRATRADLAQRPGMFCVLEERPTAVGLAEWY